MATDRAKVIVEQSEGRKLCDEALREIELSRSTFVNELARFRDGKKTCEKDRPGSRHWTVAERLLKKAQRDAKLPEKSLQAPPIDESELV